jgi:pimeloyl-ACP methyl ester carboxylesterase
MQLASTRIHRGLSRMVAGALLAALMSTFGSAHQSEGPVVSAHVHTHADGVASTYYRAAFAPGQSSDVLAFTYGGSGCVSWRDYMATYFEGLMGRITVFALNTRHVPDDADGRACEPPFSAANNPSQWVADYTAFISAQLALATHRPRRVVLLGISEGAYVAAKVARSRNDITDLAIIGDGGWTMRRALEASEGKAAVDAAWREIAQDPQSLDRTWMGHPYRWWSDIMDLDPLPEYLGLNMPILVGVGEKDQSVPVASALALRDAFVRSGRRNLTVRVYQGADHTLMAGAENHRRQFFRELSERLAR